MPAELSTTIPAWGFEDAELESWPALKLQLVSAGPFATPVLVHVRGAKSFIAAAQAYPRADGSLVQAVLYNPGDVELEPGSIVDFADVVDPAHMDQLWELLACPEYFTMVEQAEELPNQFLTQLQLPIFEVAAEALPLPAPINTHLAACPICRAAFNNTVAARQRWQRLAFCPSPAELDAYVHGTDLPGIARHLDTCHHCRTEAAALRQSPPPAWLTIHIAPISRTRAATAARTPLPFESGVQWHGLGALLQGFLLQFQLAGVQTLRWVAADPASPLSISMLVAALQGGESIQLLREHRDLSLQLTPDQSAIALHALHGDGQNPLQEFVVELWSEATLQWRSQSKQGSAVLPLAMLQAANDQSAVQLIVRPLTDMMPSQ